MEPETELVVAHLQFCIENNVKPSATVYQILNERCSREDDQPTLKQLKDQPCIYDDTSESFLRPNQLFWTTPNLGDRAFKIPKNLDGYGKLFETLEIKDTPSSRDHFEVALDIVKEWGDTGHSLSSQDKMIYQKCMEVVALSLSSGDSELDSEAQVLRDQPCILNLNGKLCYPDEVAIRDSEWHESYFGDDLSGSLTPYQAELIPIYQLVDLSLLSQRIWPEIGQKHGDTPREDIATKVRERLFAF